MPTLELITISVSAYAKIRGVTHKAVRDAIQSGRLTKSITWHGGKPKIADTEMADKEWDTNTQSTRGKLSSLADLKVPQIYISQARREYARAQLLELDLQERKGELVPVSEVGAKFVEVVQAAKTKLLGVATRIKQRLPHLTADDVREIDDLLREALEGLADG